MENPLETTSKSTKKTRWLGFGAFLLYCFISIGGLHAQSPETPKVIQDWQFLGEAPTQVDIDYRVVQCGSTPEIHLLVFNEGLAQTLEFELSVQSGSVNLKKTFRYELALGEMNIGECNAAGKLADYQLDLPKGYDPASIQAQIRFLNSKEETK